jgi:hypothetical protein
VISRSSAIDGAGGCEVINSDIFEDLFILDMAANHLGSLERGFEDHP